MHDFSTPGYKALRAEFNISFDGYDPFGSAMGWFFPLADYLFHNSAEEIPPAWGYGHGVLCNGERDDYESEIIGGLADAGQITDDDLLTFGTVLNRYVNLCELAGRSY